DRVLAVPAVRPNLRAGEQIDAHRVVGAAEPLLAEGAEQRALAEVAAEAVIDHPEARGADRGHVGRLADVSPVVELLAAVDGLEDRLALGAAERLETGHDLGAHRLVLGSRPDAAVRVAARHVDPDGCRPGLEGVRPGAAPRPVDEDVVDHVETAAPRTRQHLADDLATERPERALAEEARVCQPA